MKKRDRKRDIQMVTTEGVLLLRLSDSTPLHRDNFIRLVKANYFDSILFHRVISGFMIQAGDPNSKRAVPGQMLGNGGPGYTLPAEIRPSLFHQRGMLAAAREGDEKNPERKSSASQFYIVQGRTYRSGELDTVEIRRLKGAKISDERRAVYTQTGGSPHLDGQYTIFGRLLQGFDVLDRIATTPTSKGFDRDRPLNDVRILSVKLVKRRSLISDLKM